NRRAAILVSGAGCHKFLQQSGRATQCLAHCMLRSISGATAGSARNAEKEAEIVPPTAVRECIDSHVIEKRCNQREWRDNPVQEPEPEAWCVAGRGRWLCCAGRQQR